MNSSALRTLLVLLLSSCGGDGLGCKATCADGSTPGDDCVCEDGKKATFCTPPSPTAGTSSSPAGRTPAAGRRSGQGASTGRADDEPPEPEVVFSEDFEMGDISGFERSDQAAHEGMLGARPPMLPAGGTAELSIDCGGDEHTQIEFMFHGACELMVDGATYESPMDGVYVANGWSRKSIVVPKGPHTYTWKVRTENAGRPAFGLDTVKCTSTEPVGVETGTWGFDQGFSPIEFGGFEGEPDERWHINNSAANDGGYGVRPPLLPAGGSSELSMTCGDTIHTKVEFMFHGSAELRVDGAIYESPMDGVYIANGWSRKIIVIPPGEHEYQWKVTTEKAGRPTFALDTVKCSATEPEGVETGTWGFDQSFPPTEFTGFDGEPEARWHITNSVQNDGGYGARPPILPAGASSELAMDCGGAEHSQLEFMFYGPAELIVDGKSYESPIAGTYVANGWTSKMVPVSKKMHSYAWKVKAVEAGRPAFALDSVKCTSM